MPGVPPSSKPPEKRRSPAAEGSEWTRGSSPDAVRRLRRLGETCLWLLVIAAAVIAAFWAAGQLRLVILPVGVALVLATFLHPPAVALRRRGLPDGLAALLVLVAALGGIGGLVALLAPQTIEEFGELDAGVLGGIETIQRWFIEGPLDLSQDQIDRAVEQVEDQLRESAEVLGRGALMGALMMVEAIAAGLLAIVVLFFFLKDGERIWAWLCGLAPPHRREVIREAGNRSWTALAGFLRGQALVALFDAVFIGIALVLIGVPLVLPLVVLTFFAAFVPIVGAVTAGAAAVLVALVFEGFVPALLVLGAVIAVQQIESNIFEPVVVGKTVKLHPLAILLAVALGLAIAGILGALVAAPLVAVGSAVLSYLREASTASDETATGS
jgi:predicted PurR-regulated permease PerM